MKKLASYFIDNSFVVNLLSVVMIIFGLFSLFSMKRDLINGWQSNTVSVSARLKGASPAQVEKHLTYPIERAIRDVRGIEKMTSTSRFGSTSIRLELKPTVKNTLEFEKDLKAKIDNIHSDLPEEVEDIYIRQHKQTKSWFNFFAIVNFDENKDSHQEWLLKLKEEVDSIPGIAESKYYSNKKNLYLKFNPEIMGRYQLSLGEVQKKILDSFRIYPIGSIRKKGERLTVQMSTSEIRAQDVGNILIRSTNSGHALKVKDIATVEYRLPKKDYSKWLTNGKPSIGLEIYKDMDYDAITLKEKFEKFIEEANKKTIDGIELLSIEDGPAFIERQINALKSNALLGGILVFITLFLFLGFKNAVMTSFGLPLAYLFTFTVLENLGVSIDLISIIGMLLVIGILVDDAIIISEQYSQELERGRTPRQAALHSVLLTWKPICGTVLTTLIAFLPLLMGKDGMSNILFAIPLVVFSALLLSLFESFFILPNHLSHFVKNPSHKKEAAFDKVRKVYSRLLKFTIKWRYPATAVFFAAMIGSFYFASQKIKFNFNLNISSESIRIVGKLKKSKSLDDTINKVQVIDKLITSLDRSEYKHYSLTAGNNWMNGKRNEGKEFFQYRIGFSQLDDNVQERKTRLTEHFKKEFEKIRADKKNDIFEELSVFVRRGGGNEDRDNIIEVILKSKASFNAHELTTEVDNLISKTKIEGLKKIDLEDNKFKESWNFNPNLEEISARGLTYYDISSQITHYVNPTEVKEFTHGLKTIKIYSYFRDGTKLNFKDLNNLKIAQKNGVLIPVSELGSWSKELQQSQIRHQNLMRRAIVDIPFDKEKGKKEVLIKKVDEALKELRTKYPYVEFKTQDADEQSRKNKASMLKKFVFALVGIFFVLAFVLRSLSQPLLICSAIPFGIVGVLWSFYFQNIDVNLMAIVGIIGMAGVVVNDSLLMVVTINGLRKTWESFSADDIVEGATRRLRAIVLTSITTLGGVFPMAYGIGGDAGFTKSLAMSMGWGLFVATLLTLFLLPCFLYMQKELMVFIGKMMAKFGRKQKTHAEEKKGWMEDEETMGSPEDFLPPKETESNQSENILQ